jgi:predicted DNA-binding transcriptional regulator AlpA
MTTMARSREANSKKYAAVPRLSYSVDEFCVAMGISRSSYEKLKRAGRHPREMRIGKAVRISKDAAAQWITEREGMSRPEVAA